MKTTHFLQLLGAASCLTFASCSLWPYENSHDAAKRDGEGYSLDNPPTGSRYMAGANNTTPAVTQETTIDPATGTATTTTTSTEPAPPPVNPSATSGPSPGPVTTVTPPPASGPTAAPTYGTPVPGRRGFVFPPGVDAKPENMVDVRDFQPGQKVRDPRTGKIFLVP